MEKSKGSKVVLLLIVLLLVILIVAGGVYAYIATDLLKTPNMLFKKYLFSGTVEIFNFNIGPYKDAYKRMESEPTEITVAGKNEFNANSQYSDEEEKQYVNSTVTLKLDNQNKKRAVLIDSKLDDEEFFNLELLNSKDTAGIHIEGLHDKYISIENRDLKKLSKTFVDDEEVISMIPDKIPELSISNDEKKMLVELISNIISNEIDGIESNSYAQEKYVIDNYDGEKFEGNKYVLTISSKKFEEVITNIVTKFIEDEQVNTILKSKFPEELINKVKGEIIEYFKIEDEEIKEETMKISVYSYNGKTIKMDIIKNDEIYFEMYVLNKEISSSIQVKAVSPKTENNKVASEILVNIRSSFENNNGEISYEEKTTYNKNDVKELKAIEEEESFFYDEDEIDEMYKNSTSSAKAAITTTENDVITSKVTITDKDKNKQTSTYTMKFGNIDVPTLKSEDMIVINDYTKDDFTNLMMEMMTNASKTAEEKPNTLIGGIVGFFGNISNSFVLSEILSNENSDNQTDDLQDNDNNEVSLNDINQAKGNVLSAMGNAINELLSNYREDLENNPDINLGDYLGADKIEKQAGTEFKNVEIVDGETLKCEYKNTTFFVKIYIDGDTWRLQDIDVLYSEDGTLENAK